MKMYRGVVRGNTIVLEEEPHLPNDCPALVEITRLDKAHDERLAREHATLLRKAPRVGRLLYKEREELHER